MNLIPKQLSELSAFKAVRIKCLIGLIDKCTDEELQDWLNTQPESTERLYKAVMAQDNKEQDKCANQRYMKDMSNQWSTEKEKYSAFQNPKVVPGTKPS